MVRWRRERVVFFLVLIRRSHWVGGDGGRPKKRKGCKKRMGGRNMHLLISARVNAKTITNKKLIFYFNVIGINRKSLPMNKFKIKSNLKF